VPGRQKTPNLPKGGSLPVKTIQPPASLTNKAMLEAWYTIIEDLRDQGALDRTDRLLVEAAAVMWGRAREARELIERDGYITPTVRGTTTANPLIAVERESLKELRLLADHLPLTRAARHRLGLQAKGEAADPFAPPPAVQ